MEKNDCVQYIVVRKDLVEKMGYGKLAAQVAHASLGSVIEKVDGETKIIDADDIKKWFKGRFTKLCVYVKSKEALLNLAEKLDGDNIHNVIIRDSCLTKLEPEELDQTTITVLGIIPLNRNNIPKYLQKLRLLD